MLLWKLVIQHSSLFNAQRANECKGESIRKIAHTHNDHTPTILWINNKPSLCELCALQKSKLAFYKIVAQKCKMKEILPTEQFSLAVKK